LVDKPIFFGANPNKLKTVNKVLKPFYQMGDWYRVAMALPAIYLTSIVLQDEKLHHGTLIAMKSFGAQIMVTQTLKNVIGRTLDKNEETSNPFEFKPSWHLPSEGLLPSGHAAISWSVITSYADEYKDDPIIPWALYGAATLGSISLVTTRSHWVSDIALGIAIGYFTAKTARYYDEKHEKTTIQPLISQNSLGLSITAQF
jgi:membrane-associated phospholipid phosphatase